jgi:hypothetical protein
MGGTGFQPVKSGILPDFVRTKAARISRNQHAECAPLVSGRMPETTGWKPVPPKHEFENTPYAKQSLPG